MRHAQVVVIGGGHAGIEAAVAVARLGCDVALVSPASGVVGQMPCNPAIGGTAKGHLVREIDALGGVMGQAIDATGIQFKLLNRSRGPAVWSPRAQADKTAYSGWVLALMASLPRLTIVDGRVAAVLTSGSAVRGVRLDSGDEISCEACVLTTGTFLNGLTHTGDVCRPEGRRGEPPSVDLSRSLRSLGIEMGRLKTGTPPRLDRASIDFEGRVSDGTFLLEPGDETPVPFSFMTRTPLRNRISCWSLYTSQASHEHVREHISSSPLYNGRIVGIGPRYCPSFEDKVMRFPDRERHLLFLEPEGMEASTIYVNGLSMSLPAPVQERIVRSLPGLGDARIVRPGYAVEYDFVQPTSLSPSLETRALSGLFLAGQVNGTSGYEEAAAQGLMAGINAARHVKRLDPFVLRRDEAYIGILIDDLITKGCLEPYRMFTSRAEHRLVLRIDNADLRLTPEGRRVGLVSDERWTLFEERRRRHDSNLRILGSSRVSLEGQSISARQALRRPEVSLQDLVSSGVPLDLEDGASSLSGRSLEAEIKYEGYINQERTEIAQIRKAGSRRIPPAFPFISVPGLSKEVVQRLTERRPETIGDAARIPGMTPAAVGVLSAYVGRRNQPQ